MLLLPRPPSKNNSLQRRNEENDWEEKVGGERNSPIVEVNYCKPPERLLPWSADGPRILFSHTKKKSYSGSAE